MSDGENERCGNTVHSDYVSDHQCALPRGHIGDCLFGGFGKELVATAQDWRFSDEYVGNMFRSYIGREERE